MPAAVGQNGNLVVFNRRQARKGFSRGKEFIGVFDDDNTGPLKCPFGNFRYAGQGAGMGARRFFTGG